MILVYVAIGGAVGATARYALSGWVQEWVGTLFPWGTLAVNVAGSFVIGIILHLSSDRFLIPPEWRSMLTTGFCGGLTTFSTFSHETLALLENQQWSSAGGNTLLNVLLCLGATYLGLVVGRVL